MKNIANSHCGFVAIVGEPNSGKSTLVNLLVGEKISIVSPKCQTTRNQIKGIAVYDNIQIIFIDTPGFFQKARTSLEKKLISNFKSSYKDSDIIVVIIDGCRKDISYTLSFIEKLKNQKVAVVINKVDKAPKENVLKIAEKISKFNFIDRVFMVSAINNDGIDIFIEYLKENMPEGNFHYNEEEKTNLNIKFRLSEITREKIYNKLFSELPYNIYVDTEFFKETEKKATVYQTVVVMKESQKGIILGKGGSMIKRIKDLAIFDMKERLHKKVDLKLFIKVRKHWSDNKSHLQDAGIIG